MNGLPMQPHRTVRTSAPSCAITLPGARPSATEPMKIVDHSSENASPRGGVGSIVVRTQPTVTQVNAIQRDAGTSLLVAGEVRSEAISKNVVRSRHGGRTTVHGVAGDSRLGRGFGREDGNRSEAEIDCRQAAPKGGSTANQIWAGRTLATVALRIQSRRSCEGSPPRSPESPKRSKLLTGEPDAGNPAVRFGGRGDAVNASSLPYPVGARLARHADGGQPSGLRRSTRMPEWLVRERRPD